MHFCKNCDNMYYLFLGSTDDENVDKIRYNCKKCGHIDDSINDDTNKYIITHTNIKKKEQQFHHIINKYTKLDPTLPRISNINCPNASCISNKDLTEELDTPVENEIIYMRYDDENLKYVYICCNCDTIWKNN